MYFKARNGTYKRVPQGGAANQFGDNFVSCVCWHFYLEYPAPLRLILLDALPLLLTMLLSTRDKRVSQVSAVPGKEFPRQHSPYFEHRLTLKHHRAHRLEVAF